MRHIWPFALFASIAGCAVDPDPAQDVDEPPAAQDDGGTSTTTTTAYGCDIDAVFKTDVHRLASGGRLDLEIHDGGWLAKPRTVTSSAPGILAVAQTAAGAILTGVAPGTADIVVSRCGQPVASYPVTVAKVADVDIRLSYGPAGRSERLSALAALPGSFDQLELTYYDDQHVALAGQGAARLAFEGGVHRAGAFSLWILDGRDRLPRETVPIAFEGAGRLIATAGELQVAIDVTLTQAPDQLALAVVEQSILDLPVHAAVATGKTSTGLPVAGLAPAFTITQEAAFSRFATNPASSQLYLLGTAHGEVTFTAEVAGMTATRTVTFP